MMSGLNSYDYGTRQYYSVLPVWDRVDPLAEKFYNVSPYAYCCNSPVMKIDPDGKFPFKWMAQASRKWYNLWHQTKAGPIVYNKNAEKIVNRYTYTTVQQEGGDFVVTSHAKFDKSLAEGAQNVGDGMALGGYAATVTGVFAEVGVPAAAIGNGISTVGAGAEFLIDVANCDVGNSLKDVAYYVAEKTLEKGLNKVLPGGGKKLGEEGFNLGTEIITQGADIKLSIGERIIDKTIEEKEKEKKGNK